MQVYINPLEQYTFLLWIFFCKRPVTSVMGHDCLSHTILTHGATAVDQMASILITGKILSIGSEMAVTTSPLISILSISYETHSLLSQKQSFYETYQLWMWGSFVSIGSEMAVTTSPLISILSILLVLWTSWILWNTFTAITKAKLLWNLSIMNVRLIC